jgi:hypothetical protein
MNEVVLHFDDLPASLRREILALQETRGITAQHLTIMAIPQRSSEPDRLEYRPTPGWRS